MPDSIFHLDNSGKLHELKEANYILELQLQELLANYPALISGSQINSEKPRRWLLISREFGVPDEDQSSNRWSLDHLFLYQDGVPTLVEVKRSTDTRIRREVVGQILDYAANAVSYWSIDVIKQKFEQQCNFEGKDADEVLRNFLDEGMEIEGFWETTKTNLKAGKIRMLIIADSIPKEVQRIIEFLNEQLRYAEILGIEIKQFVGQNDVKTLVPRVIGKTTTADTVKGTSRGKSSNWTKEEFFEELENKRGAAEKEVALRIHNWLSPLMTRMWFGTGEKMGSLVPILNHKGIDHQQFAIWTYGNVEIYFQWYKGKEPFSSEEKRLELLKKLNEIEGVNIPESKISARPSFPLAALLKESEYIKFVEAFEWYLKMVRST